MRAHRGYGLHLRFSEANRTVLGKPAAEGEKGELPIVAMTANAFAEDVQLAKNTGMNGHIAKPLDMNKLNDVLENWL